MCALTLLQSPFSCNGKFYFISFISPYVNKLSEAYFIIRIFGNWTFLKLLLDRKRRAANRVASTHRCIVFGNFEMIHLILLSGSLIGSNAFGDFRPIPLGNSIRLLCSGTKWRHLSPKILYHLGVCTWLTYSYIGDHESYEHNNNYILQSKQLMVLFWLNKPFTDLSYKLAEKKN